MDSSLVESARAFESDPTNLTTLQLGSLVRLRARDPAGARDFVNRLPRFDPYVLYVLAAYLVLTGLFARCALYKVTDIDTSIQEQPYSTTDDRAGL